MQNMDSEHQKRFGQFFSGEIVAEKLVSLLPKGRTLSSVVDPMVGIGDMLRAVSKITDENTKLLGIEIDEPVFEQCRKVLPHANIIHKDSFISEELVTTNGWDLVITNPPYVRYQLQTDDSGVMPTGKKIRENLITILSKFKYLTPEDLKMFISIAENYSGLSDMAVPSWILCCALVRKGGYLAIVVPDTWLNRDYATPIQYMLGKMFKVKVVAKETNERWFKNALVKTSLVVAERCDIRAFSSLENEITKVHLGEEIQEWKSSQLLHSSFSGMRTPLWLQSEDSKYLLCCGNAQLPAEMSTLISKSVGVQFTNLQNMGIECGQGLRTGANDFFYLNIVKSDNSLVSLKSKKWDGEQIYKIPVHMVKKTIQNRKQVKGLVSDRANLETALLYIQSPVNEKEELFKYISRAEGYSNKAGKRFQDLSAVKPNERIDSKGNKRFWYMLPPLARRHLPDLCMTRINSTTTECILVEQDHKAPTIVDANMTTLWGDESDRIFIAFALLNSSWCKCFLECSCTVMGAGALKVEASHLRKLQIPVLDAEGQAEMLVLGKRLYEEKQLSSELQAAIDEVVCKPFKEDRLGEKITDLLVRKYSERSQRK